MKTKMNQLCDQLIADMSKMQQDTALLTGQESFDILKDAKSLAAERGQFNGKATIAWNRHNEWLVFSFKKDEDTESGWAITARWLADKPAWVVTPPTVNRERLVAIMVPEHLVRAMRLHLGTLANTEVGS